MAASTETTERTVQETNKATIRRWVEMAWNHGDFSEAESLYPPSYIMHNTAGLDIRGTEGITRFLTIYRTAMPDLRLEIEQMVAEGGKVAWRINAEGTQTGEFMGIPPTGKHGSSTAIIISRFENGKWVEDWVNNDDLGLLQNLGIIPRMG